MKYILLIIAAFTLSACNGNNNSSSTPNAPSQPDTTPEEKPETALETAGLLPQSKPHALLVPDTKGLPKELLAPQLN